MLPLIKLTEESPYYNEVLNSFYFEWFELYNKMGIYNGNDLKKKYKNNKNLKTFIYIINNDFVGAYSLFKSPDHKMYICDVYIKKEYRKKRIGSMLIEDVKQRVSGEQFLYICSAPNTIEFYKKNGFKIINNLEDNIVLMRFKLKRKRWPIIIIMIILIILICELIFKIFDL